MTRFVLLMITALCACALALSCGDGKKSYDDSAGDSDTDNDSDIDSDADGDTDTLQDECLGNDVAIYDEGDMQAIGGYPCIEGSLTVQGSDLITLALPVLETIDGALTIAGNPDLDALEMQSLTSVGDTITIEDNAELAGCDICDLLDQLDEQPDAGVPDVGGNLDDECTPVPENCP